MPAWREQFFSKETTPFCHSAPRLRGDETFLDSYLIETPTGVKSAKEWGLINFPISYHTEASRVYAGAEFRKRVDLPSLPKNPEVAIFLRLWKCRK